MDSALQPVLFQSRTSTATTIWTQRYFGRCRKKPGDTYPNSRGAARSSTYFSLEAWEASSLFSSSIFVQHFLKSTLGSGSWLETFPPAYLPLADCDSPAEAFETYIDGMSRWVDFARRGQTGTEEEGVPQVDVPANPEWAERLSLKLQGLNAAVRPFFQNSGRKKAVTKPI
jgi:hypothetical protein